MMHDKLHNSLATIMQGEKEDEQDIEFILITDSTYHEVPMLTRNIS